MPAAGQDDEQLRFPILIGDIGGTNARFLVIDRRDGKTGEPRIVQTADFESIDDAIAASVLTRPGAPPRSAVIAVAGPVDGDEIPLTNCPWIVRPKGMSASVGLSDVIILNDFEAQALAVAALGPETMQQIGGGAADPTAARVVLGPGTGLGVAGLVHARGRWIPVPGEGGHMDIGPRTRREEAIFRHLEPLEGRISGEQILCGRGLVNLYRAIALADGKTPRLSTPADITSAAMQGSDEIAVEALALFVVCLGRTAGDLALVFKAQGGVFLTGGIAQKIVSGLRSPSFRDAFEDKAPHRALMRAIPVFVITQPLAALAGLAAYARAPESFGVETKGRRWRA